MHLCNACKRALHRPLREGSEASALTGSDATTENMDDDVEEWVKVLCVCARARVHSFRGTHSRVPHPTNFSLLSSGVE